MYATAVQNVIDNPELGEKFKRVYTIEELERIPSFDALMTIGAVNKIPGHKKWTWENKEDAFKAILFFGRHVLEDQPIQYSVDELTQLDMFSLRFLASLLGGRKQARVWVDESFRAEAIEFLRLDEQDEKALVEETIQEIIQERIDEAKEEKTDRDFDNYENLSMKELKALAKTKGLTGYSKWKVADREMAIELLRGTNPVLSKKKKEKKEEIKKVSSPLPVQGELTRQNLNNKTMKQLKELGKKFKIPGNSKWKKEDKESAITLILKAQKKAIKEAEKGDDEVKEEVNQIIEEQVEEQVVYVKMTASILESLSVKILTRIVSEAYNIQDIQVSKKPSKEDLVAIILGQPPLPPLVPDVIIIEEEKKTDSQAQQVQEEQVSLPVSLPEEEKKIHPPTVSPVFPPAVSPVVAPAVSPAVSPVVAPAVSPAVAPAVSPAVAPVVAPPSFQRLELSPPNEFVASAIEQVTGTKRRMKQQRANIKEIKDSLTDLTAVLGSFTQDAETEMVSRIHSKVQRCMGLSES